MNNYFFIGILITLIGSVYTIYNSRKKLENCGSISEKKDFYNSWVFGIAMIICGIIMIVKNA